jgi:hypothetical protein
MSRLSSNVLRGAGARVERHKAVIVLVAVVALTSSGTAAAAVAGDPLRLGVVNSINAMTTLSSSIAERVLLIQNTSTAVGARALHLYSKGAASTALVTNVGTGPALQLQVGAGRAPITVNADAGKAVNLNADKIDGIDGTALVRGTGVTVLANRMVLPNGQADVPLLTIPGLGTLSSFCFTDFSSTGIQWRNSTPGVIDMWTNRNASDGLRAFLVNPETNFPVTVFDAATGIVSGDTLVLGRGNNPGARTTATVTLAAYRSAPGAPCGVQATAEVWTTP